MDDCVRSTPSISSSLRLALDVALWFSWILSSSSACWMAKIDLTIGGCKRMLDRNEDTGTNRYCNSSRTNGLCFILLLSWQCYYYYCFCCCVQQLTDDGPTFNSILLHVHRMRTDGKIRIIRAGHASPSRHLSWWDGILKQTECMISTPIVVSYKEPQPVASCQLPVLAHTLWCKSIGPQKLVSGNHPCIVALPVFFQHVQDRDSRCCCRWSFS